MQVFNQKRKTNKNVKLQYYNDKKLNGQPNAIITCKYPPKKGKQKKKCKTTILRWPNAIIIFIDLQVPNQKRKQKRM